MHISKVSKQFVVTKLSYNPIEMNGIVCCNETEIIERSLNPEPRSKSKLIDASFSPFLSIIGQKVAKITESSYALASARGVFWVEPGGDDSPDEDWSPEDSSLEVGET